DVGKPRCTVRRGTVRHVNQVRTEGRVMGEHLTPGSVAAIKFKWQKDDKTYDYFIPAGLVVSPGDKVVVETARGETTVEIVSIKDVSDKASRSILRAIP